VVLVVAIGVLALVDRSSPVSRTVAAVRPVGPEIPHRGAVGSTWYCAAGSAPASTHASNELVIANPTGNRISAQVTAVTSKAAPPATVAIAARSTVLVPSVADASDIVELSRPGAVVSHRLVAGNLGDEAPCASAGSAQVYFPAAATQTTLGADAQLWLFNPFPSDASLDVTVVTSGGIRTPSALSGMVVPGSSTTMVDLGKIEQRRDQFALSVVTRSGLIVAEISQASGTPAGLELVPGLQRTATRLVFADGESGTGLAERYVVFNPSAQNASVLLAVVPYNAAASELSEPFELDVPGRSFVTTDMEHQTRVIQGQPHWVRVESTNGVGIVAERLAGATATGNPYGVGSGSATSLGQSASSDTWFAPWADHSAASTSSVIIANPSVDTIAEARVTSFGAGKKSTGAGTLKAEIGPGHSAAVDLGAAGTDPRGLIITSSSPVVVERRVLFAGGEDFSVIAAVPAAPLFVLPAMSHTTKPGG